MAVENMIETRLKEPKSITYNKGAAFEKYVLADAFDNLIFYATDYLERANRKDKFFE